MKKILYSISALCAIGLIVFLWIPHEIVITSTDIETGKVDTLNKKELDKRHQESWNKFGK